MMSSNRWPTVAVAAAMPLVASCAALTPSWVVPMTRVHVDDAHYRQLLERLADDGMEGRGITTDGNAEATRLLVSEFRQAGLEPGSEDGSFLQCFEHPVSVKAVTRTLEKDGTSLPDEAFSVASFSASVQFEGDLMFIGYGIHAPDSGYTDYADVDVRGKILMLMRYEPRERDPNSPLNGDRPSLHSAMRRKVFEAKGRGAVAVLFVAPPREGEEADRRVPSLDGVEVESDAGLPVLHILPATVDAWLSAAVGTDLKTLVAAIDSKMASEPIALGHVSGAVQLERANKQLCNVVGVMPGTGPLAAEAIVVGGHFDHLGYGQSGSMQPGERAIHNGADDNASGTAAVVAVARTMRTLREAENRRRIIFIAFNGEEVGLAGSSAWVENPQLPITEIDGMINMDMIGRLRDGKLTVLGTDSGDLWDPWLRQAARALALDVTFHGDGYGPSDQTPFYANGVPVLHFFTGAHDDYHRPGDDADKINIEGAVRIVRLVTAMAWRAATHEPGQTYRETSSGPALAGDSRSFGAWLGTVPDYSAMGPNAGHGVLLSGVRKGGPADVAGVRAGDRIVRMAGSAIDNLYDMTFVLRDHHPGDVVEVIVQRGEERVSLAATLGSRAAMKTTDAHGKGGPHDPPAHTD